MTISPDAITLSENLDIIDLHIDTMIPYRLWGYNPLNRHNWMPFGRHFFVHSDLPRMKDGGVTGGMWSLTTNPLRPSNNRWKVFLRNLNSLNKLCEHSSGQLALVRNHSEYIAARATDAIAVLPAIQGANAISGTSGSVADIPDDLITRMTLVHLSPSVYGNTSSPLHHFNPFKGLKVAGQTLVEEMNAAHIFIDLAHAHPKTFWDAVDVSDSSHPLLVTHTGVSGVHQHWRNLDDEQIRTIAKTGGIIGIMFATNFLQRPAGPRDCTMIIDHLEHLIKIGGENIAAIGSDFDGFISPPKDMCSIDRFPLLIQRMLDRGWASQRIEGVLGGNFLRVLKEYRP